MRISRSCLSQPTRLSERPALCGRERAGPVQGQLLDLDDRAGVKARVLRLGLEAYRIATFARRHVHVPEGGPFKEDVQPLVATMSPLQHVQSLPESAGCEAPDPLLADRDPRVPPRLRCVRTRPRILQRRRVDLRS